MKTTLLFVLFLFLNLSFAQIYKWTDPQGNVHFSDEPAPGAEEITVPKAQVFTPPTSTLPSVEDSVAASAATASYELVSIRQPSMDETLRNNQGFVLVTVQLEPALKPGDSLQLLFDGKALGEPQSALVFQLNGVDRGTHTLSVEVINSQGVVLNSTETVTFHMHRPRIGGG